MLAPLLVAGVALLAVAFFYVAARDDERSPPALRRAAEASSAVNGRPRDPAELPPQPLALLDEPAQTRRPAASVATPAESTRPQVVAEGVAERPSARAERPLSETAPASAAPERARTPATAAPATSAPAANALVAAALRGDQPAVRRIAADLDGSPRARGDRTTARRLNERGLAASREGRHAEAAALFRQALRADAGDPEIRENLGYALLKAGELREAEPALLAALETGPRRASAWGSLSFVYAKRGRHDEAVALLRTAHAMAPDPERAVATYARQARTDEDPRVRAMLAEAVTELRSPR